MKPTVKANIVLTFEADSSLVFPFGNHSLKVQIVVELEHRDMANHLETINDYLYTAYIYVSVDVAMEVIEDNTKQIVYSFPLIANQFVL